MTGALLAAHGSGLIPAQVTLPFKIVAGAGAFIALTVLLVIRRLARAMDRSPQPAQPGTAVVPATTAPLAQPAKSTAGRKILLAAAAGGGAWLWFTRQPAAPATAAKAPAAPKPSPSHPAIHPHAAPATTAASHPAPHSVLTGTQIVIVVAIALIVAMVIALNTRRG